MVQIITGYRQDEIEQYNLLVEADIAQYRIEKNIEMRDGIKVLKNS